MSEELEHRMGTIEGSLSKFGLMLESLQTDIMQVNKGTKELAMDSKYINLVIQWMAGFRERNLLIE